MPEKKGSAGGKPEPEPLINIEELIRIQQNCVGRAFDLWANAATRISHGNFNLGQWSNEYALVLEESLDDYGQWLKTLFGSKKR